MIAEIKHPKKQESVFLVHGFLSKRMLMKPLEWRIASQGFDTHNWGYLSFIGSIRNHAVRLKKDLVRYCERRNKRTPTTVHLVAHSMGSIVLRLALDMGLKGKTIPNLGRIVLLAPPNQGTPRAKLLAPFVTWFCKGVGEISNGPNGLAKSIGPSPLPMGIIAGDYDWIVPKSHTHLSNEADHISVASTHNTLLVLPSVAKQVCEFLKCGRFSKPTISEN